MCKKLLCLVLALVMVFSFAACNGSSNVNDSDADVSAEIGNTTQESDTTEETSEESEEVTYEPLMYKVDDGKGNALYLLGSIHVGDKRVDMLSDKVMNAYNASNYLCVECDTVAFSEDIKKATEIYTKMLCPKGTTVKDQIGEETYNACQKFLKDSGVTTTLFEYYNAYFWSSLVSLTLAESTGLSSDHGVDTMFLTMAHSEGMEIREVESVEYQYDLMLSFPTELWKIMIESALKNKDFETKMISEMYEAWINGDGAALLTVLNTEGEDDDYTAEQIAMIEDYDKKLTEDRNNAMTLKAEEYLRNGGVGFFVVGAAHIIGETGIVKQLRDKGYDVTVVSGKE